MFPPSDDSLCRKGAFVSRHQNKDAGIFLCKRGGASRMQKQKLRRAAEMLAEVLELPESSVSGGLQLECSANREVVADGCTGVLEYTDSVIRLSARDMSQRFSGEGLSIGAMEKGSLVVKGEIRSIEFLPVR